MKIISFAWTTEALLTGHKTVTRRDWKENHATSFHEGDLIAAYDRLPIQGGRKVATLKLTKRPYLERYSAAPDSDFENEGLAWMQERYEETRLRDYTLNGLSPRQFWMAQKLGDALVYVVRFELLHAFYDGRGNIIPWQKDQP